MIGDKKEKRRGCCHLGWTVILCSFFAALFLATWQGSCEYLGSFRGSLLFETDAEEGFPHDGLSISEESLTLDEKLSLVHGSDPLCGYTGWTPAIKRWNIPELRMNDGPQGFRGPPGKSTAFPSSLGITSTFDERVVEDWSERMAMEFKAKGANVLLGPGLNVLRLPENGRTFEYLSGEDPVLGSQMARAAVKGALKVRGVMPTAKHFALNNQERDRERESSVVDDTVLNELYLPPFRAAVDAGVPAVMCSYNKINGVYACENEAMLQRKLKDEWGFEGFVMSDWRATHSAKPALMNGLDQEMPLGVHFGDMLKKALADDKQGDMEARLNGAVARILHAMNMSGIFASEQSPCTQDLDVTNSETTTLARKWAVEGAVMLRNERDVLPLPTRDGMRVAVFGAAAKDAGLNAGGGSGRVDARERSITFFAGLENVVKKELGVKSASLVFNDGKKPETLLDSVNGAQVAVVVIGTNSEEGRDRQDLLFGKGQEELVQNVVKVAKQAGGIPVVVVCIAPGPVLMPWAESVQGILLMFLSGQEFGNAAASILFGKDSPGGRLPLTIPYPEPDRRISFTPEQYPGVNLVMNYTEGFLTGYRWHDHFDIAPMYEFGFGLSFTEFKYELDQPPKVQSAGLFKHWFTYAHVSNVGSRSGKAVVQMYLSRDSCENERNAEPIRPPKKLIAFQSVWVEKGDRVPVSLKFSFEQIAEWKSGDWVMPSSSCTYHLLLGSSSRNIFAKTPISFS